MIEVQRASELGEAARDRITEVLVTSFADDFSYFSKDPQVLVKAFAHMLDLDKFWVATVDGEPAGIASVTTEQEECFAPDAVESRRHFGRIKGRINHAIITSQFLGAPPNARKGLAEIAFVAAAPEFQGQGVGTALIRRILEEPQFDEFLLREIKDTNEAALGLYRKLGFTEYERRPVKFAKRAGFSDYVSMNLRR